jgi:hypothetical protein
MQLLLIFYSDALALSVSFVCPDLHIIFRSSGPTEIVPRRAAPPPGPGCRV